MRITCRAGSSAGRASPLQGEGRGFEPLPAHHVRLVEQVTQYKMWSGSSVG